MSDTDNIDVHWYTKERPGWHEYSIERTHNFSYDWLMYYEEIVKWIHFNIEMPERHARWIIHPEYAEFRFRYERDYLRFILRWAC
jgi:hypothetical protein